MIHPHPPQAQPTGIPMANTAELHEPSFNDLLAALEAGSELPEQTRRHWLCSVRQIAKALDKPPELIPARWTSIRFPVARLGHAALGVTPKTLANHKSNVRSALLWFRKEQDVPLRGAPLSPEWQTLSRSTDQRGPPCPALRADALLLGSEHLTRKPKRGGTRRLHAVSGRDDSP